MSAPAQLPREPMFRLSARDRLAAPVVLVYWLALFGGLALFTLTRPDDGRAVVPLWVGALAGTCIGHCLALRDLRTWISLLVIAGLFYWAALFTPRDMEPTRLCMAFGPAALCAYWSLGERVALAAFWFPAVVWMLPILDRTRGASLVGAIDGSGAVLLGALAVLFVAYLRVRESRRVGLWRTVGTLPVAAAQPMTVLREPAAHQVARAGWSLLVSGIAFALTAFVAPQLFHVERTESRAVAWRAPPPDRSAGLACCPLIPERLASELSRVKEYLDLGRGRDEIVLPRPDVDCVECFSGCDPAGPVGPFFYDAGGEYAGGYYHGELFDELRAGGRHDGGRGDTVSAAKIAPSPAPSPAPELAPEVAADVAPDVAASVSVPAPAPDVAPAPLPYIQPPSTAVPMPNVAPEPSRPPAPAAATAITAAAQPARARDNRVADAVLPWIAFLLGAVLMCRLVALVLRPVRRLITLRHLRRPFWDETVDQRVSNAWQLALIGLRDAGWRATSGESPRDFARRVDVDGVERCASILERARHGVGIDAQDLSDASSAAETAYRSARARTGTVARALGWLRWPLT
ncbi:MAG: hypothetical protein KIT31_28960 [Deltaproteobacteria bacterium]|nr:hypothetical protein [Deltaproteobacteria bacterium]